MKRFLGKWVCFFWSWGFLKFVLFTITIIVLLYVEEDWRGARTWAATKTKWEARGESFDPSSYIPRPIPDAENLAALPIFKVESDPTAPGIQSPVKLQDALDEEKHGGSLPRIDKTPDEIRVGLAKVFAQAFPQASPPAEPLAQLEALYPIIPEIRQAAATRPDCRFNQDYATQPPMFRGIGLIVAPIKLAKLLSLHAVVAMEENQPEVAMDDIRIELRLAAGVGRDPRLVAGLVDIGITAIARGVIDNLLKQHAWSDAQLIELDRDLGRIDFLSQFQFTMRGEIITETIPNFDYIKATATRSRAGLLMYGIWPGGWLDLDKSRMVDFLFREVKCVDVSSRRVFPEVIRKLEDETDRAEELPWRLAPWNLFFTISAPTFTRAAIKFANMQVHLDEDRVVCALERYRLAHGAYPASLDVLAPAYLAVVPPDIMNGQPFHYKLHPDGTFLLYSVGWNLSDEGGKVGQGNDSTGQSHYAEGDWPWPTW
jgi:hypothetical protein